MLNGGRWYGRQIGLEQWVRAKPAVHQHECLEARDWDVLFLSRMTSKSRRWFVPLRPVFIRAASGTSMNG
jgi:hypothetical protein